MHPKVWNAVDRYITSLTSSNLAGFIPGDPTAFAVHLSDRLADFIPSMTLDFISEVSEGMGKSLSQRINCLQYLSPWVKNLAHFPNPTSPHYEPSGSRLRDCIRTLADMTLRQIEVCADIDVGGQFTDGWL